jgi:hypothetical protein
MLVYHWKDGRFIIQHNTRHIYIRTLNVDKIENNQCVINVEITHNSNIFDCHSVCTVEKYEFIVDAKLNKVSEQKWA